MSTQLLGAKKLRSDRECPQHNPSLLSTTNPTTIPFNIRIKFSEQFEGILMVVRYRLTLNADRVSPYTGRSKKERHFFLIGIFQFYSVVVSHQTFPQRHPKKLSRKNFLFFCWIDDFPRLFSEKQPCISDKIAILKRKQKISFLDNFLVQVKERPYNDSLQIALRFYLKFC